jgi:hypothetical protein
MRKSISGSRSRLVYAGLSTAAIAAALLVAPQAAFAADVAAVATPGGGPNSGTISVFATGMLTSLPGPLGAYYVPGTGACPGTYVPSTTGAIVASPTRVDNDTATVPVPSTLGLTAGAAKTYTLCIYAGTTASTSAIAGHATYVVTPQATFAPGAGPSGGGNMITVTEPTGSVLPATVGASFAAKANSCPALYSTTDATVVGTVVRTSDTVATVTVPLGVAGAGSTATPWSVCLYNGVGNGTSLLAATAATGYNVTLPPVTLNSVIGAPGTASPAPNLTVTSTNNFLTGYTTPAGLVQTAACPGVYPASPGSAAAAARKVANNKATVTLPTSATVSATPYNVCVYSSNSSTTGKLLTSAAYTATTVPTLTRVTPDAGPGLGNSVITVTGANFPTTAGSIRATIGGIPLLNIMPVSDTAFTAMTPMHSIGDDLPLVMTTDAGSVSLSAAYDYTNSLQVTPNTAPNTAPVDVDVTGVGFLPLAFASNTAASTSTDAHVYLVRGTYDSTTTGADNVPANSSKARGPIAECNSVLVVSDNELICTLHLEQQVNTAGTYTLASRSLVPTLATVAGSPIVNSATAAFTSADVGQAIVQTGNAAIPAGSTIVSVTSTTRAVISKNALTTAASIATTTVTVGGSVRAAVAISAASAGATVIPGAAFTTADIGRPIVSTTAASSITPGTTVVGLTYTSGVVSGAVLSRPLAGALLGTDTVDLYAPTPVPAGAYNLTIVNDGELSAPDVLGATYMQSTVSSGSTFTVAPF